ncbi:hypothetical protein GCM10022210_12240 [Mucilaginibacter dorajii]|uniref:Uncharacterized protein n=2 Tax=Mucilaginibacter dorajii TaxID=692994 RepID=A0ABP7PGL1_9SPHI
MNCRYINNPAIKFNYDSNYLDKAWETNDTVFMKGWILNLDSLDFKSFAYNVSDYARVTGFNYGNIDLEGDLNKRWSISQQKKMRYNVKHVYNVYLNSCSFLNKRITLDEFYPISVKYWRENSILAESDLENLRKDINSLCKKHV